MAEENESADDFNVSQQIAEANARLPVDLGQMSMPLEFQIRTIALTVAQRHCGDTTIKEGNLYQQLKMDNKLAGPLTVDHVIHAARVFEMFLWGKWSAGIAGEALTKTLDEMDEALKKEFSDEPPVRPHSGGGEAP